MCLTWCHKRNLLFWNHESCPVSLCGFAGQPGGDCAGCRHRRDDGRCALTHQPLPDGGCCHRNITLTPGPQPVTAEMLDLLWPAAGEPVTAVLDRLAAPYTVDNGAVWVDPDDLGLPAVYGVGTDEPDEPDEPEIPILQNYDFEW